MGVYVSPTQVATSVPYDNTVGYLTSTDVQAVILEFNQNYLIAMVNNAAKLIKTQRVMAGVVLRGQTNL